MTWKGAGAHSSPLNHYKGRQSPGLYLLLFDEAAVILAERVFPVVEGIVNNGSGAWCRLH
jgi:hypothetical protein